VNASDNVRIINVNQNRRVFPTNKFFSSLLLFTDIIIFLDEVVEDADS